jgi:hypothetical protein
MGPQELLGPIEGRCSHPGGEGRLDGRSTLAISLRVRDALHINCR